jgi:hypothetical protein
MNYGTLVPSFYFYKFAEYISKPFTSFDAYRSGAIDERGKLLKPESSIDPFEYFVIKLKLIFDQLPPGLTKYHLGNYVTSLRMFTEECKKFNIQKDHFISLMEGMFAVNGYDVNMELLNEDMTAGGMSVAGGSEGYNTGGVSGFDPPMAMPMQRRKAPVGMEKLSIFDVDNDDEFARYSSAKTNSELPRRVRRFIYGNPESSIMIRHAKSGKIHMVPKQKSIKEEFNLIFEENTGLVTQYNDADQQGEKAVAAKTDKEEQFKSKGRRTMVSVTFPVFERNKIKEAENAAKIFTSTFTPTNNVQAEDYLLDQLKRKFVSANYKFVQDAKAKEELKAGEFGIFKEGGDSRHADIHVGMEHPETKELVHLGIESGWTRPTSTTIQKGYVIRLGTQVKIPKLFKRFGKIKDDKIDVKQGILDYGELKGGKKRVDLWPSIQRAFGEVTKKVKDRYVRPMAHEAIRERPDDISIIGNYKRLTVTHHRKQDSHLRMLSDKLMKDIGLDHTHELEELTLAKSPSHGGSTPRGGGRNKPETEEES